MARWRGSTEQRGYGSTHQRRKRELQPLIDAGKGWCTEPICFGPTRWIPPGSDWDLAHTPDRAGYRGPAHKRCNRSEGATRGNRTRPRHLVTITGGPRCGTCGIRYHYPARNCVMCGSHYHPSYREQRTCSRTCGANYRRRTARR